MKDLLGRELKVGDTVVTIRRDYIHLHGVDTGVIPYMRLEKVKAVAPFATQLQAADGKERVVVDGEELFIVEMSRGV